MRIKTQDYNGVTVVELQGELEADCMTTFQSTVSEIVGGGSTGIVLDMSQVGFIDSKGLERLLWARDYCNSNKSQLKLAGLDENCEMILEVTRLEDEFERYAELAEAVKSFV